MARVFFVTGSSPLVVSFLSCGRQGWQGRASEGAPHLVGWAERTLNCDTLLQRLGPSHGKLWSWVKSPKRRHQPLILAGHVPHAWAIHWAGDIAQGRALAYHV